MSDIKYRPDIDGLRAIAVLLVIIYHFNNEIIPSGFLGVDIFFVISGFIITLTIAPQIRNNQFSFIHFYEKRIKRILPLLFTVFFISTIFAYLFFTPNDLVDFANSLRYSSAFIANIYFEKNTGYFAPSSETMPLLHIWSLAVEEQFYFIWPILLFCALKYFPKRFTLALFSASCVLLAFLSQYLSVYFPAEGYFSLQSRGGELLIGASISLLSHSNSTQNMRHSIKNQTVFYTSIGVLGLVLLGIQLATLNKESLFPGFNAYIVAMGVACIIYSGENKKNFIYKFLSHPYLVIIGKHSYSLYLWHWPIQAFYRYYYGHLDVSGFVFCALLTVLFSILSLRLIENPLRFLKIKTKWVYLFYFFLPLIACVFIAKYSAKQAGFPERFSGESLAIYNTSINQFESKDLLNGYEPFQSYIIGAPSTKPNAFIYGDSHAQHYRGFIDKLSKDFNLTALYGGLGGCPPLAKGGLSKYGKPEERCEKNNQKYLETILSTPVEK